MRRYDTEMARLLEEFTLHHGPRAGRGGPAEDTVDSLRLHAAKTARAWAHGESLLASSRSVAESI